jgi:hypothetical protein
MGRRAGPARLWPGVRADAIDADGLAEEPIQKPLQFV